MTDNEETVVRHERVTGFLTFALGCLVLSVAAWICSWAYYVIVDARVRDNSSEISRLANDLEDCKRGRR